MRVELGPLSRMILSVWAQPRSNSYLPSRHMFCMSVNMSWSRQLTGSKSSALTAFDLQHRDL